MIFGSRNISAATRIPASAQTKDPYWKALPADLPASVRGLLLRCLDRDDMQGVGDLMLRSAHKLAACGADFVVCPDNTIHQAFDYVVAQSPLPWLHISEVVADEAVRCGFRRLGLTKAGPHPIQGIGANFIPKIRNRSTYHEVIQVTGDDAKAMSQRLAKEEGILVGISSGAACWAALQVAAKLGKGKRVVTVLPDGGERYLSMGVFGTPEAK